MVEYGDAFSLQDVCSQYVGGKWDLARWSINTGDGKIERRSRVSTPLLYGASPQKEGIQNNNL